MENSIFIGCNYSLPSIKKQFDAIKKEIERKYPLKVVIIDKRLNKGADDIWNDIRSEIENSSLLIFDVTEFRPNVVLELGYAFAKKRNDQILITYQDRKKKTHASRPTWSLSDIPHLQRNNYKNVSKIREITIPQIQKMQFMKKLSEYDKKCNATNAAANNKKYGYKILRAMRDSGHLTKPKIKEILKGSHLKVDSVIANLLDVHLIAKNPLMGYGIRQ